MPRYLHRSQLDPQPRQTQTDRQESRNDDLVSSTLYSLLNLLSHGGSTIAPGGGAASVRSHPAFGRGEDMTMRTNLSGGRRSDEQKHLVAVTAVEVVSRLALEMGRDDVSFSPSACTTF